jgi:hypothetical protein
VVDRRDLEEAKNKRKICGFWKLVQPWQNRPHHLPNWNGASGVRWTN